MRYYIADCHFFHDSLNRQMDCRGFANAEEMNNYMIAQWNTATFSMTASTGRWTAAALRMPKK